MSVRRPSSVPMSIGAFRFGAIALHDRQVFFESALSYACVNIKPVVPGHCLVISKRIVARVRDLEEAELADMWRTAQRISTVLERHHAASALTLTIQDGPAAGQSIPHVHIHVLPRRVGDFAHNDQVYAELEEPRVSMDGPMQAFVPRTMEDMATEAAVYRGLLSVAPAASAAAGTPPTAAESAS